jgi:hypothetical protein
MEILHGFLTLARVGLVFNIAGTLMVTFSFGKNLADVHQVDRKGRQVYLASFLYPRLFNLGLFVIILGFILQFVACHCTCP